MLTMKNFSVHTFYYTHNSYETMLKSLKAANVDQIELYGSAPLLCEMYTYTQEEHAAMIKEKKELLDRYGIKVRCIFIPTLDLPINIASLNEQVYTKSVDVMKAYVEDAACIGAEAILLDSGYGLFDKDPAPYWEQSVKALKEITVLAEENGIIVYIRPMGTCTNLVNDVRALEKMIKEVDSPMLKPCLDAGIMAGNGENVLDYTDRFGKIDYVRIGNFGPDGEICEGIGLNRITDVIGQIPDFDGDIAIEIGWERLDIPDSASIGIGKEIPKYLETL